MTKEHNANRSPENAPDEVPALPTALTNPTPVVLAGMLFWLLGFIVFGILELTTDLSVEIPMWTCLAGVVLGLVGYSVFRWQRHAARRGARTAQRGF